MEENSNLLISNEARDYIPVDGAPITIAFSVYTANNGYDWSNIPDESDREGLDYYYQKAVAFKPDFMVAGDVVKGVFSKDGNVAAFRIQIVKRWDCFGRDADYCAFAFVRAEDAKFIDFDALLEHPEFTEPTHTPPVSVCYTGEFSKDFNSDDSKLAIKRLYNGEELNDFDFAKIGALISEYWNKCDEWLFSKVQSTYENSTLVKTKEWREDPFPPPPPPPPDPKLSPIREDRSMSSAQPFVPIVGEIPQPTIVENLPDTRSLDKPSVIHGVSGRAQAVGAHRSNTENGYRKSTLRWDCGFGGSVNMRPVTQRELEKAGCLVNASRWPEVFDMLHWVLIVLCTLLVILVTVLVFPWLNYGKTDSADEANFGQCSNCESPKTDFNETPDSNPRGGK